MINPSTQALTAVHFFTEPVTGPGAARQRTYLDALASHGTVTTVHLGRFHRKTHTCRRCGSSWITHEEKESDVALAVRAVADAAAGEVDQAWFVSGDSDMCPSVRAVRRIAPAMRTVAVFPPRRSSVDLRRAVHGVLQVFDRVPSRHQLPDPVIGPNGAVYARPTHWH
jgi:hypothetical protein